MNKRKEIMIALALILAAGAAVVGSRMIKNNKHSEVNTETENASEKVVQESELVADRDSEEVPQETQEKVTDTVGTESDRKSDTETPEAYYADDFYIEQVLTNYITNAGRHLR